MRAQYTVPEVRCQKVAPFGSGDLMRAWHVADHRFGVRSGAVTGILRRRKRQVEFIELLEEIDRTTPALITLIHLLCDNLSVHHGKQVQAWLSQHPRFRMHFTPVHCSWMNQVEHWFSILQRKRLVAPNVQDLADLEAKSSAPVHRRVERRRASFRLDAQVVREGAGEGRRRSRGAAEEPRGSREPRPPRRRRER